MNGLGLIALAVVALAPPQGYERAVAALPPGHWALVRSATIDRTSGGQARRADLSIHLTPHRRDAQLWHEVGHIVMYADATLERDWRTAFWPDGSPRHAVVSRYARINHREDFAESYQEYLEHGGLAAQPERDTFLRTRVFAAEVRR